MEEIQPVVKDITFGEIRHLAAKTSVIVILLTSVGGDVFDTFINMEHVPESFNDLKVIGFGEVNCVKVDGYDCLFDALEFYLDDIK